MVELPTSPLRGRRHSATGLFERVAQLEKDRGSRVRRDRLYQLYFITVRGPRGPKARKGIEPGFADRRYLTAPTLRTPETPPRDARLTNDLSNEAKAKTIRPAGKVQGIGEFESLCSSNP